MIRLSRSDIGEAEQQAVMAVMQKGFLGMGGEVNALEQELAVFFGGDRQVVCVNTGTSALHLAVQACGIGPDDEVLVPSLTYVASFQAVAATGARPVACDIDPQTLCLDPEEMRRRITPRTKAVMPVHYASGTGKLAEIYRIAEANGLRVIEDAAHAFGCREGKGENDRLVGSFGDVACFSFDGIKNITCGEGGAVVTADAEMAERVRNARLLGVEKDTENRFKGLRSWDFDVKAQGWRYHMSDLMAAIGRVQLQRFPEFAQKRVALARAYEAALGGSNQVRSLGLDYGPVVPHIYPVRVNATLRDELRQHLEDEGVQTGLHYKPNHLLSLFREAGVSGTAPSDCPVSEEVFSEILTLPLHTLMTVEEVEAICKSIESYLSNASV
jgi:dTDP-4-amino-4,6-dideoxygalactose transaminase